MEEYETITETENYSIMKSHEDGSTVYHVFLGGITLHLMPDEWDEFATLAKGIPS